jgi:hypothetical protein
MLAAMLAIAALAVQIPTSRPAATTPASSRPT